MSTKHDHNTCANCGGCDQYVHCSHCGRCRNCGKGYQTHGTTYVQPFIPWNPVPVRPYWYGTTYVNTTSGVPNNVGITHKVD